MKLPSALFKDDLSLLSEEYVEYFKELMRDEHLKLRDQLLQIL